MEENTDSLLEEKCEHLMNIVVETRKQFGKLCVDYNQKAALVENKMLKLQLKSISMCRFKAKPKKLSPINTDDMKKDLEEFSNEIILSQQRFEDLSHRVSDLQSIVLQLKNDAIGKKLNNRLTTEALFLTAKRKNK